MVRRLEPDEWDLGFAHRLRVTRIMLGLTEEEAAAAAGRTAKTWRRYEATGLGNITAPLVRFCGRFDISLDWLFRGEESVVPPPPNRARRKIVVLPVAGRNRLGKAVRA